MSKKIERLRRQINYLYDEIEKRERFPEDNFKEGTVIKYRKRFTPGGINYRYAAIKVNGLWFTTGPRSPKGYTWDELTEWMDDGVQKIRVATGWTRIL